MSFGVLTLPRVDNVVMSGSSGTFSTSSTTLVTVTNLSVTINTTGRPVLLAIVPDGGVTSGSMGLSYTGTSGSGLIAFNHSGAGTVGLFNMGTTVVTTGTNNIQFPSFPFCIDTLGSSGAVTYTVQVKVNSSETLSMTHLSLMAFEL